jgi:hypothetical protein
VNQAATTTAIASSLNPSAINQAVTFTATVAAIAPGAGVPTGTVNFTNGGTAIGSGTLDATGKATLTVSNLPLGSATIAAAYAGDASFTVSASTTLTQVVRQASTTTALTSSAASATYGQPVTLTANVTATLGTPTGTVTFLDGSTALGTSALSSAGQATLAVTLPGGAHSITVTYSGDTNDTGSTSSAVSVQINAAASATALTTSAATVAVGANVTLTATVTSGAGVPDGSVTFNDGSTVLATVALNASGVATTTASWSTTGAHTLTAVYAGNANFATSTSPAVTETVSTPDYSLSVTPASQSVTAGGSAGFTVTVAANNLGWSNAVALSCPNLAAGLSCAFNPASVTPGATQATSTLTIQTTTAAAAAKLPAKPGSQNPTLLAASGFAVFGFVLVGVPRRNRRWLILTASLFLLFLLAGCGGGSTVKQPKTYTVTISASSNGVSHTTTTMLTVQ